MRPPAWILLFRLAMDSAAHRGDGTLYGNLHQASTPSVTGRLEARQHCKSVYRSVSFVATLGFRIPNACNVFKIPRRAPMMRPSIKPAETLSPKTAKVEA